MGNINIFAIFLTGLTIGGLTCLAVQGGLLASVIAAREEAEIEKGINPKSTIFPTLAFLSAKLFTYTVLGFILGLFGGAIGISPKTQVIMQFAAGLYMIAIAFDLLNVHPIFKYAVIQPPKFLTRRIRNQSKSKDLFAPVFLGLLTIFIPCGTTLAIEALAISSANAFLGALIMAVFVLGTTPLFFGVGLVTSFLGDNFREKFLKIAAVIILYLGLTSINGAMIAGGFPVSLQSVLEDALREFNLSPSKSQAALYKNDLSVKVINDIQNVDMTINSKGYSPNFIVVKKGQRVKLNLKAVDAYNCASAFRIPALGIAKNLQPNSTESIEFTPQNAGQIVFTCSMGMYKGVIEVI